MARLTLEIPDETHRKLKTLAAYCGMSMKDFLLDRALAPVERSADASADPDAVHRAEELLFSGTTTFKLSPDQWDAFCQALDAPANPTAGLRSLMNGRSVLDAR